jgi:hypothetical protein
MADVNNARKMKGEKLDYESLRTPDSPGLPKALKDPNVPAFTRLMNLQEWRKKRHNQKCPVINPLTLIPNRLIKNARSKEELYGQTRSNFALRLPNWAMKEDPRATEELFEVVRPFALVMRLDHMKDPDWYKCMPPAARDKVDQLCVVATTYDEPKDFLRALPTSRAFSKLQCIELLNLPRLISHGRGGIRYSHANAVLYGMRPEVRLFTRWSYADDTEATGKTPDSLVGPVKELVIESTAAGEEKPKWYDASYSWSDVTWQKYSKTVLYPWLLPKSERKSGRRIRAEMMRKEKENKRAAV